MIGGGPGGYVCAIKAAQLGMNVTCVEGRGSLGGTCLNVGCIPSKSLLNNSHKYHEAKHDFAKRGINIEGLSFDFSKMMGAKSKSISGLTQGIEGLFKKNKVTYSKGWGKITGANEVTVNLADGGTEVINTKNIVIATGSEPASLPGVEIDEKNIVSSTGALEFTEVPENLIVIGAGVIGLEMGSVYGRLGSNVTVVEFQDKILPGMDGEIQKRFQQILKKDLKFDFQMGMAVQSATVGADGKITVTAKPAKGGDEVTYTADKVLVATGRRPYTAGLGLEEQGIATEGNPAAPMIDIDPSTWASKSHPNVYGIGDAVRGAMLAHKAEEEGIAVAESLAGQHGHVNYNAIPGVVYTYPEVASVGKTEEQLKAEGIKYNKGKFNMMANSRARCNDDFEGMVKVLTNEKDTILGCHIIGPNAGEMIAEAVIGIEYGASSEDLARTCHAHPTLSEAFKEACLDCFAKPIHS